MYPAAVLAAAVYGALVSASPKIALALLGGAAVVRWAWSRPVPSLIGVVFLTGVVPYGIQKLVGVSRPGLLLSDVLLIVGIGWGLFTAAHLRLDRRWLWMGGALCLYLTVAVVQLIHGVQAGADLSQAGFEFRIQLGLGAFFLAVPLVRDPQTRAQVLKGLLVIAALLGFWGVYQYFGKIPFSAAQDYGVRQGVALTANGRGQV